MFSLGTFVRCSLFRNISSKLHVMELRESTLDIDSLNSIICHYDGQMNAFQKHCDVQGTPSKTDTLRTVLIVRSFLQRCPSY